MEGGGGGKRPRRVGGGRPRGARRSEARLATRSSAECQRRRQPRLHGSGAGRCGNGGARVTTRGGYARLQYVRSTRGKASPSHADQFPPRQSESWGTRPGQVGWEEGVACASSGGGVVESRPKQQSANSRLDRSKGGTSTALLATCQKPSCFSGASSLKCTSELFCHRVSVTQISRRTSAHEPNPSSNETERWGRAVSALTLIGGQSSPSSLYSRGDTFWMTFQAHSGGQSKFLTKIFGKAQNFTR